MRLYPCSSKDVQLPVFVDQVGTPQSGILVCNSRVLCADDAAQTDFLGEMARIFSDELILTHRARGNNAYLVYASRGCMEYGPTICSAVFIFITVNDNIMRSLLLLPNLIYSCLTVFRCA